MNEPSVPIFQLLFQCGPARGIPVFIITWVVARLTFFLNPAMSLLSKTRKTLSNYHSGVLPAQDILEAVGQLSKGGGRGRYAK